MRIKELGGPDYAVNDIAYQDFLIKYLHVSRIDQLMRETISRLINKVGCWWCVCVVACWSEDVGP